MKIVQIRKVSQFIFRYFNNDKKKLLTSWIIENLDALSSLDELLNKDNIFDTFADESTKDFNKLIKELNFYILSQQKINRIHLINQSDGYYLELNDLGRKTNLSITKQMREKFLLIEKQESMDKGLFYENFCTLFLEDLGLESERTKISGDKGIDIKAKYNTKLEQDFSHLVFNDAIYLLAQVKFYMKKVDTPVLRKLLGDSILIQFDEFDYVEIAHNAFHLLVFSHSGFTDNAFKFAIQKKIMTLDTEQIISIIGSSKNPIQMKSYLYLESYI